MSEMKAAAPVLAETGTLRFYVKRLTRATSSESAYCARASMRLSHRLFNTRGKGGLFSRFPRFSINTFE